jgi:DNA-binding transcriptional regulator GbsR (MarR family)
MVSRVSSEASNLVGSVVDARLVKVAYLENREKKTTYLPVSAFSQRLRQRVYDYLSRPAREELEVFRQMKDDLTNYDKAVRYNKEIIDDLSRLLRVREAVDVSAEISRLKADLQDLKDTREELKRQCEIAGEAKAEAIFRKLKQAQGRINEIVSKLQKLEQKSEEGA